MFFNEAGDVTGFTTTALYSPGSDAGVRPLDEPRLQERTLIGIRHHTPGEGRGAEDVARLLGITAKRKAQGRTDLTHAPLPQPCHAFSQALLRDGHRIVKIDDTAAFHTVCFIKEDFGWHSTDGGCDRSHSDRRQVANRTVAC